MRAGRDTGTLSAHRTRVRNALVAAFPEEGFHVGQHDAGEVVLLVLRQAEKQCDLRTQGEVISSKQCLSGKCEMAIPLVHSNVAEALDIRSTQIIEERTLEHARSSETLRFASCAKDCEGPWLETLTYSFGD